LLTRWTCSFVNDPKTDHLIRWAPSGNSFMVLDEDEFSKTLIPDLFKHNNYASFVRQLNMYGFHKVVGLADGSLKTSEQRSKPPSEYENPYFKRGQQDLMWLIQKPKSKNTRGKGKKGVKQEEQDTDREDNGSDAGGGDGDVGAYIEGPKDSHDGHHGGAKSQRFDFQAIVNQIEAIRNHQAMISAAINRLRKDHQQLYEQSLAFQSLHDRHENSINAILTFLATVYDKSLGGHINGAVNNLFSHQVDQGIHRAGAGAATGPNPNGAIIPTTPTLRNNASRTPQMNRRKPLLLEGAPSFTGDVQNVPANGHAARNSTAANGAAAQPNFQQNLNIQELFNNPGSNGSSPSSSPQQQPTVNNPLNAGGFTPITRIPDSPIPSPAPPRYTSTPGAAIPVTASNTAVPTPRSIAKALGQPFASNAQALQDHNNSLAQKSREMEELEHLQSRQNDNIDQLMGLMRDYSDNSDAPINGDGGASDVDQFFDFGLQGDNFVAGDGLALDGHSVDIDELLRGVDENVNQNDTKGHILGTDPSTVATSPTGSSVGGRTREELEEEIEEVQPKRRRVA
jgi:heat shock transcription factor